MYTHNAIIIVIHAACYIEKGERRELRKLLYIRITQYCQIAAAAAAVGVLCSV